MSSDSAISRAVNDKKSWVELALIEAAAVQGSSAIGSAMAGLISDARQVWGRHLFPTPKLEAWKYTNPEIIANTDFRLMPDTVASASADALLERARISGLSDANLIVFIDGRFSESASSIRPQSGVQISRLSDDDSGQFSSKVGSLGSHRHEAFAALATALFSDCLCISLAPNQVAEGPIHVVHISTDAMSQRVSTPRLYIEAREGAQLALVESYLGLPGTCYLSLPVVEIRAEENSKIDYYRIQSESERSFHVAAITGELHRNAEVRSHVFSFGGALVRNNAQLLLRGTSSNGLLNGLSILSDVQHTDNSTLIHHIEPNCESREHFKGVYAGASRGVFSGTITVEKIAQKTNAFQSNQALLLSPDASIEARPQLKIWADDVKCTHGATVGQLDQDAMFYLRSRGISKDEAQAFLVHAFASEVLSSVRVQAVKEYVERLVTARLHTIGLDS